MSHLRAKTSRQAFDAFDWQRQIAPDHAWYADIEGHFDPDRYGLRDALLRRIIPNELTEQFRSVGVVGHRGAGKTTMVRSAIAAASHEYAFASVTVDALASLDEGDFGFADVLLTLVNAVAAHLDREKASIPDSDLKLFHTWFSEELLSRTQTSSAQGSIETSAQASGGIPLFARLTAKLAAIVRSDSQTRREIRQVIERDPRELVRRANMVFDAAAKALDAKQLLIVIDNLEKINNRALVDTAILRRADEFRSLRATLILFLDPADEYAPVTVNASQAFPIVTLPMLPIRQSKDGYDHVDPAVVAALRDMLGKRAVLDQVFAEPDAAIRALALHSGGRLRDVLELARNACELAGSKPVAVAHIRRAAEKAAATRRATFRADDVERLTEIARTKRILNDPNHGYLLLHSLVLHYNGRPWWDLHPLLLLEDDIRAAIAARATVIAPGSP